MKQWVFDHPWRWRIWFVCIPILLLVAFTLGVFVWIGEWVDDALRAIDDFKHRHVTAGEYRHVKPSRFTKRLAIMSYMFRQRQRMARYV